jgi:5-hydroxyisourate hydrolase
MSETLSLSTHVLDLVLGKPAPGITVKLFKSEENQWHESFEIGVTDKDGRYRNFKKITEDVCGTYKLIFETTEYFERLNKEEIFYPSVEVNILVFKFYKYML